MIPSRYLLGFLAVIVWACSGPGTARETQETISREKFVEAYVELRIVGLSTDGQEMTLGIQNRILDSLGVEEGDLLQFVDVHGSDVQYMRRLWEEVDSILDARRRPEEMRGDPGPS